MRAYQEIESTARDESPFSNGTDWEIWAAHWCWRPCMNPVELHWRRYEEGEVAEQLPGFEGGCPLILCSMMGKTPAEWLPQPEGSPDRFHCIEFRSEEGEGEEPQPIPDPPGQGVLFSREQVANFYGVPLKIVSVQKLNTLTHEGVTV